MARNNTVEIILSARDHASQATKKAFDSISGSASSAMGVVGKAAGAAVLAVTALIGVVGKVGVEYNAMMEQSQIAWETILGSQEAAAKTLKELQVMGAKTPFEFEGLDKAAKLLNMAGYEGDNLFKTLTNVGDAVSAVGGGQAELEGISMAIFQMASKGKISAEEMNQLAERGIPAWKMVADAQGKSVQEIMKMSENGQLFAKDVLPQLTDQLGKKFGGAMEKQSHTFNGMLSTIKDNLKILSAELSKPLFENLKKGMEAALPILDGAMQLIKGDTVGFADTITKAFGQENGLLIMKFFFAIRDGVTLMQGAMGMAKDAIQGVFELFMGNEGKGVGLLAGLGLSPETIQIVVSVVEGIKNAVSGFFSSWVGFVTGLFSGEGNLGESFVRIFNVVLSIAVPILSQAFEFIKGLLAQLSEFWKAHGDQIVQAVQNAFSLIASIIGFLAPVILFIIQSVWENVKGVIQGALDIILGIVQIFTGLFTGDWNMMWEGIKQLFFGALEFLWNLFNLIMLGKLIGGIKAFIEGGIGLFKSFGGLAKQTFDDFLNNIVNLFGYFRETGSSIWRATVDTIGNIISTFVNAARSNFGNILDDAVRIFNNVKSAITSPIETAKNIVRNLVDEIKSFFSNLTLKLPDIKTPHFKIKNWSPNPVDWISAMPSLDVDWYDKGGVFYGPQVIGVGEKRPEFVGALDDLRKIVREESGGGGNTYNITVNGNNVDITEERLLQVLQREELLYG
ncbi:tape measure protein [Bacillus sp. UNC322MFChir4.1]|uniref:tape measure protein n=1 Tax=Bacillus sp. UNC322MFChir4.1 TaxID=1449045 RepID=UPI00054FF666|nr:tape measure protein [Bacillus sp. UNC322MFChir4.1]